MKNIAQILSLNVLCLLLLLHADKLTAQSSNQRSITFTPNSFIYKAGPADNPLKGLVPYQRPAEGRFPHSMEFGHLPLSTLVTGPEKYNWLPLEEMLESSRSRGNQTVFRVFLEYPGREHVIPRFLIDGGLQVHHYMNTNTAPFPPQPIDTPDYEDKSLRATMRSFIDAMGKRYDGDPRIAYITAGLLGTWGEWHTYPKTELWASKEVQKEVLDAYAKSFKETPVLLRYPAGPDDYLYADTVPYSFGYHDDSFSHSTLNTGRPEDNWFFHPRLRAAGLAERWQTAPIGGEIRPEVWGCCFDDPPCTAPTQSFDACRDQTHVTWLMDTGLFREEPSKQRYERAVKAVQKMGYDLFLSRVTVDKRAEMEDVIPIRIEIENRGVAPFYAIGWSAEFQVIQCDEKSKPIVRKDSTKLSIKGILPGQTKTWTHSIVTTGLPKGVCELDVVIPNPMKGGKPLRLANNRSNEQTGSLSLGILVVQ